MFYLECDHCGYPDFSSGCHEQEHRASYTQLMWTNKASYWYEARHPYGTSFQSQGHCWHGHPTKRQRFGDDSARETPEAGRYWPTDTTMCIGYIQQFFYLEQNIYINKLLSFTNVSSCETELTNCETQQIFIQFWVILSRLLNTI